MPSNCTKRRLDWVPGNAAWRALLMAETLFPEMGRQAVVDKLVIFGLSAYLATPWRPPALPGNARHTWKLPADLEAKVPPGK